MYDFIDTSNGFYSNPVDIHYRSKINVPIRIRPDAGESTDTYTRLELKFIKEAEEQGFMQLKGHSCNPGIRVSMYNAMPLEGIQRLCAFMERFMHENSGNSKIANRTRVHS